MDVSKIFSDPGTAVFLVPISAIVVGGVVAALQMYFKYQERIEMIRNGMHPDSLESDTETEDAE